MNTQKLAQALTNIADGLYEASEALTEQPAVERALTAGVAGGAGAGSASPGLPEIPPIEEVLYADELQEEQARPLVLQGSEAMCPKHHKPFVPSKFAGKPAYCTAKSDEPDWSRNGFCSITAKSAIVWLRKHAAVPA